MPKLLAKIADALVLQPSRRPLSAGGKQRHLVDFRDGQLEVWTHTVRCQNPADADIYVLKFAGKAGRAERSTHVPLDHWSGLKGHVWSVNPPGYGGSSGRASLGSLAEMAATTFQALQQIAGDRPIVVMGTSLGTLPALYLGVHFPVAGLILRNPPPLKELIVGHYGWWNLWVGAKLIASQVPPELCSVRNAAACSVPAVFITSRRDRVVPRVYQQRVSRTYQGPKRILTLRSADHGSSLNAVEQVQFGRMLNWLRGYVFPHRTQRVGSSAGSPSVRCLQ